MKVHIADAKAARIRGDMAAREEAAIQYNARRAEAIDARMNLIIQRESAGFGADHEFVMAAFPIPRPLKQQTDGGRPRPASPPLSSPRPSPPSPPSRFRFPLASLSLTLGWEPG